MVIAVAALVLRDVTEALAATIKLMGAPADESDESTVLQQERGYSGTWRW
jgi:hypothetical protein